VVEFGPPTTAPFPQTGGLIGHCTPMLTLATAGLLVWTVSSPSEPENVWIESYVDINMLVYHQYQRLSEVGLRVRRVGCIYC